MSIQERHEIAPTRAGTFFDAHMLSHLLTLTTSPQASARPLLMIIHDEKHAACPSKGKARDSLSVLIPPPTSAVYPTSRSHLRRRGDAALIMAVTLLSFALAGAALLVRASASRNPSYLSRQAADTYTNRMFLSLFIPDAESEAHMSCSNHSGQLGRSLGLSVE